MTNGKIAFVFGALLFLEIFYIFIWLFPYTVLGIPFPIELIAGTTALCAISSVVVVALALNGVANINYKQK